MNNRKGFINYVKNGGDAPFISLQIGAGAGFDCKLAQKEWISEGTLEDTIRAYEIVGCNALINVLLPDVGQVVPELTWQDKIESTQNRRVTDKYLQTPYRVLHWQIMEQKRHGITPTAYPVTTETENSFDIINWYAEQNLKAVKYLDELVQPILRQAQPYGPVSIQWNVQPFELFGLASVENLAMMAMLEPDKFHKSCELIRDVNIEMAKAVFAAGADFIFLGAPGVEMLSPKIYEEFIVPYSKPICRAAHEAGGLIYSHICSPIEPFLSKGYYNEIGIDLFETLSPPPVGNVTDLAKARKILDSKMCTRGNVGLDVLLNGSEDEIEQATIKVIEATKDYKHIVAASDYLFYDIPLENVKRMVQTVQNYEG